MAKLLEKPQEIRVRTNASGTPLGISRNGSRERVTAIYEQWKVADQWWGKDVERHYFRIRTAKGVVLDIFRDSSANHWYLSRIHD